MKLRTLGTASAVAGLLAFAISPAQAATISVSGGVLTYAAEPGEDNDTEMYGEGTTITVVDYSGSISAPGAGCLPSVQPSIDVPPAIFGDYTCTGVSTAVKATGDDGFDFIFVEAEVPVEIDGGDDEDGLLSYGPGTAKLTGGAGDDFMSSAGGADTLDGGDGDDRMDAGTGADQLTGGAGDDRLMGDPSPEEEGEGDFAARSHDSGPPGDDTLDGGAGADLLYGGGGADTIAGGEGRDAVELGGGGADKLAGDIEVVFGGETGEELLGGATDDDLYGFGGADRIAGAAGNDDLFGGDGNDTIDGGPGADTLDGGPGDDILLGRDGEVDRFACGDGIDKVVADANDLIESTCETVDKPGGVTGPGVTGPVASGPAVLTAKAKAKRSGRKQTVTVSGTLAGTACQGLVRITIAGLRPGAGSTTVKPDCTFTLKLVGFAKKRAKLKVAAVVGTVAAKPVIVRAR